MVKTRTTGSHPSARGFTLIEMLVVLAIMSILAVIAAPRLATRPAGGARQTVVQQLSKSVREAREQAARSGSTATVRLADLDRALVLAGSVDAQSAEVRFHADGSSSGGTVMRDGQSIATIGWLTGELRHVR